MSRRMCKLAQRTSSSKPFLPAGSNEHASLSTLWTSCRSWPVARALGTNALIALTAARTTPCGTTASTPKSAVAPASAHSRTRCAIPTIWLASPLRAIRPKVSTVAATVLLDDHPLLGTPKSRKRWASSATATSSRTWGSTVSRQSGQCEKSFNAEARQTAWKACPQAGSDTVEAPRGARHTAHASPACSTSSLVIATRRFEPP
mmetsp:Transcript_13724/g.37072  ORF Transcript_13724/g.37072 Transcript_13724/m.37072 type:complete len:204 (-) Transcript_13724:8-619(-)